MPAVAPPPAPVKPAAPARRRASHALDEPRPDLRIGLVGTILVHVALVAVFFALPEDWLSVSSEGEVGAAAGKERPFEIELSTTFSPVPELKSEEELAEMLKTLPPPPDETAKKELQDTIWDYISINPFAPEDIPDESPLFSSQPQQSAQPAPTSNVESFLPELRTSDIDPGNALARGSRLRQRESIADEFKDAFVKPSDAQPSAETPVPKLLIEELTGRKDEASSGETDAANALPEGGEGDGRRLMKPQDGVKGGKVDGSGYFAHTPKIDRNNPQPRRRLDVGSVPDASPMKLLNQLQGTNRVGILAASARWSEFGDYLARMYDSIALGWEKNLMNSQVLPTRGVTVVVTYRLNSKGEVSEIVEVKGDGSTTANLLCVSAITNPSPYGEWPSDMRAIFGDEEDITFGFRF